MKMPKKVWIIDTVSLCNFLLSDSIFILEKRFKKQAIITSQVYDELSSGFPKYPQLKQIDMFIANKTFSLRTLSLKERSIYIRLISSLGKGEASCIATAKERSCIIVTDDSAARRVCLNMNIPFTGTIGILKSSVIENVITITTANKILKKMIESGFYSPVRSIDNIAH